MRLSKWAAFAVLFGFIIILDPTHTPGQPPRMGGGNGGPPRMDGGGGMKNKGMMDPEGMWRFYQMQTQSTGDTIDLSKVPGWLKEKAREGVSKYGTEPMPESGLMSKSEFMDRSKRTIEKIEAAKASGGGGGPPMGPGPSGPPMGPGPGGGPPRMGGNDEDPEARAKKRIEQQDKNGDNKVSKEEADGMLRGNFDKFDTNKDGFLDVEEYKNGIISMTPGGNRDKDKDNRDNKDNRDYNDPNRRDDKKEVEEPKPKALRYDTLPENLPEWYKPSDSDRDGQVALHEWRQAKKPLAEFNTYDLNGDGLLTADELLRYNRLKEDSEKIAAIEAGTSTGARTAATRGTGGNRGAGSGGSSEKSSDKGTEKTSDKATDKSSDKGTEKTSDKDTEKTSDKYSSDKTSERSGPFMNGGKIDGPPKKPGNR